MGFFLKGCFFRRLGGLKTSVLSRACLGLEDFNGGVTFVLRATDFDATSLEGDACFV